MALTDILKNIFGSKPEKPTAPAVAQQVTREMSASMGGAFAPSTSRPVFSIAFNGEKTVGEIGPIKDYILDYEALRLRSWQAMLESEIAQMIINKYITWVVGKGLKLQSEPAKDVLAIEGITVDDRFSEVVESLYAVYSDSRESDYSRMLSKNWLSVEAFKNAIVGGDVLVILRYENDDVTVQLIDGAHVVSPMTGDESWPEAVKNGNRIECGIELSRRNEHVAYYVRKYALDSTMANFYTNFETQRIPARGPKTGQLMAFMVYGSRHRMNNVRGMPLIGVCLESINMLQRYREATVGSAEERAKIPFFIEHGQLSTGENPMLEGLTRAFDADRPGDIPVDVAGEKLAANVAATSKKDVYNMPKDSKIVAIQSQAELYFKDFFNTHIELMCGALEFPPDVAKSLYNANYSASRAAVKDWEHTLLIKRAWFGFQFEQPIYNFWLWVKILQNKVQAEGYLMAVARKSWMIFNAWQKARFVGANVPHIDPMKEVQAERLKLGTTGAAIPLTTVEAATEALNGGESTSNMDQFASELQKSKDLGIEVPMPAAPGAPAEESKNNE